MIKKCFAETGNDMFRLANDSDSTNTCKPSASCQAAIIVIIESKILVNG